MRIWWFLFATTTILFLSCSNGDNTSSIVHPANVLQGRAIITSIASGTVTVYAVDSDGSRNTILTSSLTNDKGEFVLQTEYSGTMELVVSGGNYIDGIGGVVIDLTGQEMSVMLDGGLTGDTEIAISPLTTAAVSQTRARITMGMGLATALSQSNTIIAQYFGLNGINISATLPHDLTDHSEGARPGDMATNYAASIMALSQFVFNSELAPVTIVFLAVSIGEDLADGFLDGKAGSEPLAYDVPVVIDDFFNNIDLLADQFLASLANQSVIQPEDVTLQEPVVTGRAFKSPISAGNISLYPLLPDGSRGELLTSAITDADGYFTFGQSYEGCLEVVVEGGSYLDEATGVTVDMADRQMSAMLPDGFYLGENVSVTPLTWAAAVETRIRVGAGADLVEAITLSNTNVADQFGLFSIDIINTIPHDLTDYTETVLAGENATDYAVAIATLSQQVMKSGLAPEGVLDLAFNIGEDLADGILDNMLNDLSLSADIAINTLVFFNDIELLADDFLASDFNKSDVVPSDVILQEPGMRDERPPRIVFPFNEEIVTETTWSGKVSIDENGVGYCIALNVDAPTPTVLEIRNDINVEKVGKGGLVAMDANGPTQCVVTGLNHSTSYDFYFVAEDIYGNLQTEVSGPVRAATVTVNRPPVIKDQYLRIDENVGNETTVGFVISHDPDTGDIGRYSILSGNNDGSFTINEKSGEITVNNPPGIDYERAPSHALIVQVTDTNGPASDSAEIIIHVNNLNETPVILPHFFTVDENVAGNTVVGIVTAEDEDNDAMMFHIANGNGAGIFSMDASSGEITVNTPPGIDFETTSSHNLIVHVSDDNGRTHNSAIITITINDLNDAPNAVNQLFNTVGNVGISEAANSLKTGVTDPDIGDTQSDLSVTAYSGTGNTAQGGDVTVNADGSFIYVPRAGFRGPNDTFFYEICDDGIPALCDTAIVTVGISGMAWFLDNSLGPAGDGRSSSPFNTLAAFEAINGNGGVFDPGNGDSIFLAAGASDYTGGVSLEANQIFIGEGASQSLNNAMGIVFPLSGIALPNTGGSKPILVNAGGDAVILASNNKLQGFTVSNTSGVGIKDSGGTIGTLLVNDIDIIDGGHIIEFVNGGLLSGISGQAVFDSFTSITSTLTPAINLNGIGGNMRVNDTPVAVDTLIIGATHAITIINSPGLIVDFADTTVLTLDNAVELGTNGNSNAGANVTFDSLYIYATVTGNGLNAGTTGTIIVTENTGTIYVANGTAINFQGPGITLENGAGGPLVLNLVTVSSGTNAIYLDNVDGGGLTVNSVNINDTSSQGVVINDSSIPVQLTSGTIGAITTTSGPAIEIDGGNGTISIGANITNTSDRFINIADRTGGIITLSGNINDTGSGGIIQNNTAGSIDLSGSISTDTGVNPAISLINNTGSTLNFIGDLDIVTTSGNGFSATGGGTVNVSGGINIITTTTGTALYVDSTEIGGNGLNFQSISSNGAVNGILLNDTSTSGGLSVTGTGGAGSGGTIQNTTGDGISITNVGSTVNLHDMSISNSVAAVDGLVVDNSGFGSPLTLVVDNFTVTGNDLIGGMQKGMDILTGSTGSINATITNNTITDTWGNAIQFNVSGSGASNVVSIDGNTVSSLGQAGDQSIFVTLGQPAPSTVNVSVTNNQVQDNGGVGLALVAGSNSAVEGIITGNTFNNNDSGGGTGMWAVTIDNGTELCLTVSGNTFLGADQMFLGEFNINSELRIPAALDAGAVSTDNFGATVLGFGGIGYGEVCSF